MGCTCPIQSFPDFLWNDCININFCHPQFTSIYEPICLVWIIALKMCRLATFDNSSNLEDTHFSFILNCCLQLGCFISHRWNDLSESHTKHVCPNTLDRNYKLFLAQFSLAITLQPIQVDEIAIGIRSAFMCFVAWWSLSSWQKNWISAWLP